MSDKLENLLQKLLTAQADQQTQFTQALNSLVNNNPDKEQASLFSTINSQISEFVYEPENDQTFQTWFERFGEYITTDGKLLNYMGRLLELSIDFLR
ncbi:hypothetical protein niasHT_000755 [Heterodera trifolii]|uniref:DUF7083 domain-containing protein n=1 Tax=Heterodera trifolii TaxID=157864 RepID=A0ABD2LN55_9BILA